MKDRAPVPEQLLHVFRAAGHAPQRCSYRMVLSWFGASAPSVLIRRQVIDAIGAAGLVAAPSLEGLSLDATVTFTRAAGAPIPAGLESQAQSAAPPPPRAVEPEIASAIRRTHGSLRVADIPGALELAPAISPQTTCVQARTRLQLEARPGLVVVTGSRAVRGVVSWRSLALSSGSPDDVVTCEPAEILDSDARLLDGLATFERSSIVVVLDAQRRPCGPIDAAAALRLLRAESEPYLLIDEIEHVLRSFLDAHLTNYELSSARKRDDSGRSARTAADLTFGEYERLLQRADIWSRFGLDGRLDRKLFIEKLAEVRILRNRVMHFDRTNREIGDVALLRKMLAFLRHHLEASV